MPAAPKKAAKKSAAKKAPSKKSAPKKAPAKKVGRSNTAKGGGKRGGANRAAAKRGAKALKTGAKVKAGPQKGQLKLGAQANVARQFRLPTSSKSSYVDANGVGH